MPASPESGVQIGLLAEARVLAGAAEAAATTTASLVLGRASASLLEVGGGEDADPPESALHHVGPSLQDAAVAARSAHRGCYDVAARFRLLGHSVFELQIGEIEKDNRVLSILSKFYQG